MKPEVLALQPQVLAEPAICAAAATEGAASWSWPSPKAGAAAAAGPAPSSPARSPRRCWGSPSWRIPEVLAEPGPTHPKAGNAPQSTRARVGGHRELSRRFGLKWVGFLWPVFPAQSRRRSCGVACGGGEISFLPPSAVPLLLCGSFRVAGRALRRPFPAAGGPAVARGCRPTRQSGRHPAGGGTCGKRSRWSGSSGWPRAA